MKLSYVRLLQLNQMRLKPASLCIHELCGREIKGFITTQTVTNDMYLVPSTSGNLMRHTRRENVFAYSEAGAEWKISPPWPFFILHSLKATFTILLPLCPTRASALSVTTLILAENWKFTGVAEVGRGVKRVTSPPGLPCTEERKKKRKKE